MLIEKTFDTGEIVINFAEGETAGPPLVLLHGATLNWQTFGEFISALEPSWHLHACDLRGHGKAERGRSAYLIEDFVRDTVAFIERQVGEPVVLAGFSMGAAIALGAAARLPGLVRALILLEPPLCYFCDAGLQSFPGLDEWVTWLNKTLSSTRSFEEVVAQCQARAPDNDEAATRSFAQQVYDLDPQFIADIINNQTYKDYRPEQLLAQVICPTLLVYGETSLESVINEADIALYHQLVPHGRVVHLKDVGHDVIEGAAGQAALEQVTQFLNSL